MSKHTAKIVWERGDQPFTDGKYSRGHMIYFDGGVSILGSSAPAAVRPPLSREDAADPEELLVAALSNCHMLFFLHFARKAGLRIDSYVDEAEGVLETEGGKTWLTRVALRPRIAWSGDRRPTPEEVAALHHEAHEACFIANSFRGTVEIEAV